MMYFVNAASRSMRRQQECSWCTRPVHSAQGMLDQCFRESILTWRWGFRLEFNRYCSTWRPVDACSSWNLTKEVSFAQNLLQVSEEDMDFVPKGKFQVGFAFFLCQIMGKMELHCSNW